MSIRHFGRAHGMMHAGRMGMGEQRETKMQEPARPRYRRGEAGVERLLTLSDGVFAIAITLLILNVQVPDAGGRNGLTGALLRAWPQYLSYVSSFLTVGIVWANHHSMFLHIRRTNHLFLLFNVVFLLWVASIPFPTSVLARYLTDPGAQHTAMALYASMFFMGSWLLNLLWWYATHGHRLTDDSPDLAAIKRTTVSYCIGPASYALDVLLAFVSVPLSLALSISPSVFYAVSPMMGDDRD
jgi:uncharacterized membrane protein